VSRDQPRHSGALGDFVLALGVVPERAIGRLSQSRRWPTLPLSGDASAIVQRRLAPQLCVWSRGAVRLREGISGALALCLEPAAGSLRAEQPDVLAPLFDQAHQGVQASIEGLRGRFAWVQWDLRQDWLWAATDGFRTCPIVWARQGATLWIASDLRLLLAAGAMAPEVSMPALYQYLNFGYVAAPLAALQGAHKLPAASCLVAQKGKVSVRAWWDARYPADLAAQPEDERVRALREQIVSTVSAYRPGDVAGWGAFLSGGTDSSSICGILAKHHPHAVNSFSIGFEEEGYDELGYAGIAARAYHLDAHEYRVREQDAVAAVTALVGAFDEPFGNASAIPTHECAQLARRHGVDTLLAGDGGDEIYGGNERYRKDAIFEMFYRAPAMVRALAHGAAGTLRGIDARWANRVKNFVRRGSLPNPDRFYTDDAFASEHFQPLLTAAFRAAVAPGDALDFQRTLFGQAEADHSLHRLMYLDLKMTIADNDVVKVVRASRLAGVDVQFPYLDRQLVDFTGRLPWFDKLRGKHKRYLFKRAADDILPEAIRKKRKQGFGLPISVWLRRGGSYHDLVHDVLLSSTAHLRQWVEPAFMRQLIEHHEYDAWDHAAEIHQLMMLELWCREMVAAHD
jgi:asparagine synthase (glutamine-hydrolysing)